MSIFFSAKHSSFTDTGVIDLPVFQEKMLEIERQEEAAKTRFLDAAPPDIAAYAHEMSELNKARFVLLDAPPFVAVSVPDDAVEISNEQYQAFMAAEAEGRAIHAGVDGYPFVLDRPITADDVQAFARQLANTELAASDYKELPSYRERKGEAAYNNWMKYRAKLRNFHLEMVGRFEAGEDGIALLGMLSALVVQDKP